MVMDIAEIITGITRYAVKVLLEVRDVNSVEKPQMSIICTKML